MSSYVHRSLESDFKSFPTKLLPPDNSIDAPQESTNQAVESKSPSSPKPVKWRNILQRVLAVWGGLLLWVAMIQGPQLSAGPDLDRSWGEAYSYFLIHQFKAGQDYCFAYGPLGHFLVQVYEAKLYWVSYWWELSFKGLLATIFVCFAARLPTVMHRVAFCLVIGATFLWPEVNRQNQDGVLIFAVVASFVLLVRNEEPSFWRHVVPFCCFTTALALMKFTLFVFGILAIGLLVWHFAARKRSKLAIGTIVSSVLIFMGIWSLLGQPINNIAVYLSSSMEVARGYEEAMSWDAPEYGTLFAFACVTGVLLVVAILPRNRSELKAYFHQPQLPIVALVGLAILLAAKHGFVRAEPQHIVGFFRTMLCVAVGAPVLFFSVDTKTPPRVRLLTASGTACLFCFLMSSPGFGNCSQAAMVSQCARAHVGYLLAPEIYRRRIEDFRKRMADRRELPQIKAAVGIEPVDIFSWEQGTLFLNEMNWRPRPVFQSYCAFTPWLLNANAEFYRSERAPRFVIFKLQSIDNRLQTMEDGAALLEILWRYELRLCEQSYVLLEKRALPQERLITWETTRDIAIGEEIDLSEHTTGCQSLALRMQLTRYGRLRKAVYHLPEVTIELRTASGGVHKRRMIPAMTETGFLLNPLIVDRNGLVDFFDSSRGDRVVAFRVDCETDGCYESKIEMAVQAFERPEGTIYSTEELRRLAYPMLRTPPDSITCRNPDPLTRSVEGSGEAAVVDGRNVLFVGPDIELHFKSPGGPAHIEGFMGASAVAGKVQFEIEYRSGGQRFIVLDKEIVSKEREKEVRPEKFSINLPDAQFSEVVLRTSYRSTHGRLAAYWSDILIAPRTIDREKREE